MSWTDTILSNTVGLGYRAFTGNVDPWTLNTLKADQSAERVTALGPNATDAEKAVAAAQAASQVDSYLVSVGAHPDQPCGLRLPGLGCIESPEFLAKIEKIVYGLLAVGAAVGAFYLYQMYGSALKKTFERK